MMARLIQKKFTKKWDKLVIVKALKQSVDPKYFPIAFYLSGNVVFTR